MVVPLAYKSIVSTCSISSSQPHGWELVPDIILFVLSSPCLASGFTLKGCLIDSFRFRSRASSFMASPSRIRLQGSNTIRPAFIYLHNVLSLTFNKILSATVSIGRFSISAGRIYPQSFRMVFILTIPFESIYLPRSSSITSILRTFYLPWPSP